MHVVCLQGATVVDFAYHVHTDVGNHMKAAKVNGKPVHSDYALKNAEVRSPRPCPQRCTSKGDVPALEQCSCGCMWCVSPATAVTPLPPGCTPLRT